MVEHLPLLVTGVLVVALLYSSVGHAGASGYIAVMTLFGLAPEVIKPTALTLNILVASLASYQFWRAGHFSWRLFWPFALLAIPFAYAGGLVNLPVPAFELLIALILLLSAARLLITPPAEESPRTPSITVAFAAGSGLGLLAGLTGTGGGIFLTPLIIFKRWAHTKTASAVSALFILCNSVAGLAGNLTATQQLPAIALPMAGAVLIGGAAGSYFGSRHLPTTTIKRLLAAVLAVAGMKLVLAT
jgi:uncharacterized protein